VSADGQLVYSPRGGAKRLFECRDGEVLIAGPSGTGKSRGVLEKINALCELHAGIRCLLIRRTRKSLTESVLVTFEHEVLAPGSPVLRGPDRSHRSRYNYGNGSEIALGGLDDVSRVMSSQFDLIFCNEATEIAEEEWEVLLTRLRNGRLRDRKTGECWHQAIGDANPAHPTHWLKMRSDTGQMTYIASEHKDNPSITPEYLQRLSELSGVLRKRLFEGRWVAAEGLVYDQFDPSVHVVPAFDIPSSWTRIRAIDFGFRDAFVCLWLALSPDGTLIIYRQWIKTQTLVEDHAAVIHDYSKGEPITVTTSDHACAERGTLERCGIYTIPARKDITTGVQELQARLRPGPNGKPRLLIFEDSVVEPDPTMRARKLPIGVAEEMASYVWSQPRPGGLLQEKPKDGNDHALDALRYACMLVPIVEVLKSRARVRPLITTRPWPGGRANIPRVVATVRR